MTAYLDTQSAAWLYTGEAQRLSTAAKREIEANELLIAPMVLLEFQYLYDRRKIKVEPLRVLGYLSATYGIRLCELPFPMVAHEALSIGWTSDPFDRLIVAQAQANGEAMLITSDRLIRQHYRRAVW